MLHEQDSMARRRVPHLLSLSMGMMGRMAKIGVDYPSNEPAMNADSRVATGYGQPPSTLFDWTLASSASLSDPNFALPTSIKNLVLIEQLSDKITKTIYSNRRDPVGLTSDSERPNYVALLSRDLEELEDKLQSDSSQVTKLYLRATALHLRLSALFSPPSLPTYRTDLIKLLHATKDFLDACFQLESSMIVESTDGLSNGNISLLHVPNYIFQMVLASGFVLHKLKNTNLDHQDAIKVENELFSRTIWAIRNIGVSSNDLPHRLAEVLAQLWKSSRTASGMFRAENGEIFGVDGQNRAVEKHHGTDTNLQLKVRCRMSMSLVYDSVWRWREDVHAKGQRIDATLKDATDPSSLTESAASSTTGTQFGNQLNIDNSILTSDPNGALLQGGVPGMPGMAPGFSNDDMNATYNDPRYEVFDPLTWMLDGLVDFPYNLPLGQGLEPGQGSGGIGDMI
ncbi:MAG: hypothetical protein Q9160_006432 [Pyrenula sp. 1 TL-2023]